MKSEPLDANKSPLTHKITALASKYMECLGCKPIETEVPIGEKWVADLASYTYATMFELKHSKIFKSPLFSALNIPVDRDLDYARRDWMYQTLQGPITVAVEVKISQNDFVRDNKNKFKRVPLANLNFIAYPKRMDDYVERRMMDEQFKCWGRLVCSDRGYRMMRVIPPRMFTVTTLENKIALVSQVGIRRHHRTAYAYYRMMDKSRKARYEPRLCGKCQEPLAGQVELK